MTHTPHHECAHSRRDFLTRAGGGMGLLALLSLLDGDGRADVCALQNSYSPIPSAGLAPRRDVPYVSQDTGTVFPGMAERDVYSLWGAPAAVRHLGEYTYLYFQNGCEYSCGIMDVVTLHNGQVTDAIVRWYGHGYAGQSTSPAAGEPGAPSGSGGLQITPDSTQPQPTTP